MTPMASKNVSESESDTDSDTIFPIFPNFIS